MGVVSSAIPAACVAAHGRYLRSHLLGCRLHHHHVWSHLASWCLETDCASQCSQKACYLFTGNASWYRLDAQISSQIYCAHVPSALDILSALSYGRMSLEETAPSGKPYMVPKLNFPQLPRNWQRQTSKQRNRQA